MRTDVALRLGVLALLVSVVGACPGCGSGDSQAPIASIPSPSEGVPDASRSASRDPVTLVASGGDFRSPAQADTELHPEVAITTNLGTIRVRLNWERAPRTVANFLYNYVEAGFYDQTIVHYVDHGYMFAAGGYTLDLQEKNTQPPIPCEAHNQLKNKRGTIAMARHPGFVNSATSQFFINLVDNPGLDYRASEDDSVNGYCVFGEVIEGMDVVDRIAEVPVQDNGEFSKTPVEAVVIQSITRTK